jgi:two-component system invasion response regulator UvrY
VILVKVLVVDDAPYVRAHFAAMLAGVAGVAAVFEAGNAEEALAAMRAQAPDVVLLDLHLPGGSGLALVSQVKRECPEARLYVVTNDASPPYRRLCLALGADAFFDKSRDFEAVVDAVAMASPARQRAAPGA